ncbi:hypothetical protein AB0F71_20090 [Kitasatospora sp. NPDC028055]|uniref:hypothetical protein n=1 Tax=Kitasatospora sp. NPDC028055 TaxID=3155653 RepID=UPI0033D9EAF3
MSNEWSFPDDLIRLRREYNAARRAMWADAMESAEPRHAQLELQERISAHPFWESVPDEQRHIAHRALKQASLYPKP